MQSNSHLYGEKKSAQDVTVSYNIITIVNAGRGARGKCQKICRPVVEAKICYRQGFIILNLRWKKYFWHFDGAWCISVGLVEAVPGLIRTVTFQQDSIRMVDRDTQILYTVTSTQSKSRHRIWRRDHVA